MKYLSKNKNTGLTIKSDNKSSKNVFQDQAIFILIFEIALIIIFAAFVPNFISSLNISNIVLQSTIIGMLALGQTFVLITGGIDLSSAYNLILAGVLGAKVMKQAGVFVGIITMLVVGSVVGLINGLSVAKLKMVPFIVTLATQTIVLGLALLITKAITIGGLNEAFVGFTIKKLWFIPMPVVVVLVLYVIAHVYLSRGSFGRSLVAVGLNIKTSNMAGINTDRIIITSYIISGLLAGVAAILLVSKLGSAGAGMVKEDFILDNISAAVIGGASLYGGKGTAYGTAIGVLLIVIISNAMNLLGISAFTILIIKGFIILVAIIIDTLREIYVQKI